MEAYSAYRVKICGYSSIFRQTTELHPEIGAVTECRVYGGKEILSA